MSRLEVVEVLFPESYFIPPCKELHTLEQILEACIVSTLTAGRHSRTGLMTLIGVVCLFQKRATAANYS
jgi:hypothetical protein